MLRLEIEERLGKIARFDVGLVLPKRAGATDRNIA
jgi:hypothetical protein